MLHKKTITKAILGSASVLALSASYTAHAQDASGDEVIATGIRQSLSNALDQKRNADSLTEVILSEDIGKLPDQNLAEVLENITGIQITRTAGVGTGVQIRGTNANRIEINGVSTVPSGSSRTGINFEDLNASIIAGVEVIKAPEASTIEGSVGGTINLQTIRPLDLNEPLASIRLQGEDSNLSTEGIQPRISGAIGNKWENAAGQEIGFVLSGSYTQQEAVSFRPRADRDNIGRPPGSNPAEFLSIQFLVQEQENFDFETINLSGSFEARPAPNLKLFLDGIYVDQERAQDSYRLQASGVSAFRNVSVPSQFETVDFGVGPGQFPAALVGTIEPDLAFDDDDPNLRFSSDTGARITESNVLRAGAEWNTTDKLTSRVELAYSSADTVNPTLNTTLNFFNPNCPPDGTSSDNCVPFRYDLRNNSLAFGVNFDSPFAPSAQDLLNPANIQLRSVNVGRNSTENREAALRFDFNYDTSDYFNGFVKSFDFGYRRNESSSRFEDIDAQTGNINNISQSPNGSLFADLLVPGPSNFGDADGRDLFIENFLLIDPDRAFSDPQSVINSLQAAIISVDPDTNRILTLESDQNSFFNIDETTDAFYAQANFEQGIFRGNVGLRYIDTTIDSTGFGPEDANGQRALQTTSGSYDFVLPRANLIIEPREDFVIRASYGSDIRRPDFNQLSSGFTFTNQENTAIRRGNPELEPEEVDSFDISFDWYFAPAAVLSVGYFNKQRTNIIGTSFSGAEIINGPTPEGFVTTGGLARDTDPNCPGGGIFNPEVIPNQLGDPDRLGLCVDFSQPGNDPVETTQEGIEVAFQYDLSNWEERFGSFGWASGFGVVANYTYQEFSGGSVVDTTSGRGLNVLGPVSIPQGLLDFSNNAYNLTGYYEKYGLSARVRYTWREGFRTNDFGGGANTSGSSTFSFPVNTLDRGQLNASITYDVNEHLNVGVEGVNLTKSNIFQHCVAETGPLCFAGFPDRRITFGARYKF